MTLNDINPESFYGGMRDPYEGADFEEVANERTEDIVDPRPIDLTKIDNIEFDDVDMNDYPDFCDVFIDSADMNGLPMTELELELLNKNRGFIYEKLITKLF